MSNPKVISDRQRNSIIWQLAMQINEQHVKLHGDDLSMVESIERARKALDDTSE